MIVALIAATAVGASACGQEDLGGAPNVKGLTLDVAQIQLKDAGFGVSAKDDSLFGVIIASHFTVCAQHTPTGKLVPLDVSKLC
jgi:beta-lactam-binding protein with PASTA domain